MVPYVLGPNRDRYKRAFDLAILFGVHVLLFPLWLFLWIIIPLCIWLDDRGPIFYTQLRSGKDGKLFKVFKFRTMRQDAQAHTGTLWVLENDPRTTRVGRFIRCRALDELPQMINIWKGDMSLVGPRALPVAEQEWFEARAPDFAERLKVRPGLTGIAQVFDRVDDSGAKLRFDLEYIRDMSPWLDLQLLHLSVLNTFAARWDRRAGKMRMRDASPSLRRAARSGTDISGTDISSND